MNTYNYKRQARFDLVPTTGVDTQGSMTFSLTSVNNFGQFTNLYDQYRINRVRVRIMPVQTEAEVGSAELIKNMYTALDFDDNSAGFTVTEALQRQYVKRTRTNRQHVRTFAPRVLSPVYRDGLVWAYSPKIAGWIDCAQPDVPHYGVKYCIEANTVTTKYQVIVDYYLSFKCCH